jgi:hypothetical protein
LLLISRFFFWKPGSELQKSLAGLYRSLLYDILQSHPGLIQHAFPEFWEEIKGSPWQTQTKFNIPTDVAKSALERIIFNSTTCASEIHFCFFIDGLDEFEQSRSRDHVYLVGLLNEWIRKSQGRVKLIVSSRDYNVFLNGFSDDYRLQLHELTWFDMKRYVRDSLAHLANSDLAEYFSKRIPKKADGIFLWTVLVVNEIRKAAEDELPYEQICRLVDILPSGLESLFRYILNGLNINSRQTAYQVMLILRTGQKHHLDFTILEFSLLEDYQKDSQFSIRDNDLTGSRQVVNKASPATYLKRLRGICGGLIECHMPGSPQSHGRPGSLSFTHRSIYEMLDREDMKQDMDSCLGTFNSVDALSHTTFAIAKQLSGGAGRILCLSISWMRLAEGIDRPPYRFLQAIRSWAGDDILDQDSLCCHSRLLRNLQVFSYWGLDNLVQYKPVIRRESFPILCQAAMVWNIGFVRWNFERSSTAVNKPWKRALIASALLDTHLRDDMPIEDLRFFFDGPFLSSESACFKDPRVGEGVEATALDRMDDTILLRLPNGGSQVERNAQRTELDKLADIVLKHLSDAGSSSGKFRMLDGLSGETQPDLDDPRSILTSSPTSHDLTIWQRYLVSCFLGWIGHSIRLPYPFHPDRFGLAVQQFLEHGASSEFLASIDDPNFPAHISLHFNKLSKGLIVQIELTEESSDKLLRWETINGRRSMSLRQWIQALNLKNEDYLLKLHDSRLDH